MEITYIRVDSLFRSERLSSNIKLALHTALIRSVMTYACSPWEFAADTHLLKFAASAKQRSLHYWLISEVHIGPRVAHGSPHTGYL
jgi:hypothetical protein